MPKFTQSQRNELKSMVRTHSILKFRDSDIIASIKRETGMDISQSTLTRIKSSLKRDSVKWYNGVLSKRYEFMALIRENWDSFSELKRLALDNYSEAKELKNMGEKRKNLELLLRIEEDIAKYLDALQFLGYRPSISAETLSQLPNRSDDKEIGRRLDQVPF